MIVEFLQVYLPIVVYILLIIILVIGIVIGLKAIKTLDKLNQVVDDVNQKMASLNGVFSLIDLTTYKIVLVTDTVVEGLSNVINKIFFNRKRRIKKDE